MLRRAVDFHGFSLKIKIHEIMILPLVLYGVKPIYHFKERIKIYGVFVNRILRGKFVPNWDEITRGYVYLNNDELT